MVYLWLSRWANTSADHQELEPPTLLGEVNTSARLTCLAVRRTSPMQQEITEEEAPQATTSEGEVVETLQLLHDDDRWGDTQLAWMCSSDHWVITSHSDLFFSTSYHFLRARECKPELTPCSVFIRRTTSRTSKDKESPNCHRRSRPGRREQAQEEEEKEQWKIE